MRALFLMLLLCGCATRPPTPAEMEQNRLLIESGLLLMQQGQQRPPPPVVCDTRYNNGQAVTVCW